MKRVCCGFLITSLLTVAAAGCGDGGGSTYGSGAGGNPEAGAESDAAGATPEADAGGDGGANELDPQVPPADPSRMPMWLAAWESEQWEKEWTCEASPTAKTEGAPAIHVHNGADGKNRVCNNARLAAANVSEGVELPKGSAALKFLGDDIYVEVKVAADSASGNHWYWYAPRGAPEGQGIEPCRSCHAAAGSDADHPGLGDYVYFQVQ